VTEIQIGSRKIGRGHPTFIIAEISANHNKSIDIARETILAAAAAGADAIKLQTYRPDTITFPSESRPFRIADGTVWDGRTLFDLYEEGQTPWEWHEELFRFARQQGLEAFSSPFDPTAVHFLMELGVPAFKVASFEIVDIPLIRLIAKQGLPVILSTGIAQEDDIAAALLECQAVGNDQVVILKCTSAYPAPFTELNLRTIEDIPTRFGYLSGLSDHTMSTSAAVIAVAMGASIIERHIILDRRLGGLDSSFSTDALEFAELVQRVREAELAVGEVNYDLTPRSAASRRHSRSLFVIADVKAGDAVSLENVRSIRPADGMPPKMLSAVLGRRFVRDTPAGTPLSEALLEGS